MKSCIKERRGRVGILKGKINQNFWNQTKNTKIILKNLKKWRHLVLLKKRSYQRMLAMATYDSHRFQASSREYS